MERREALYHLLISLPGIAAGSALMSAMSSCQASRDGSDAARVLSPAQLETLEAAVERIIPTTDTPGARDAGVARYIDAVLAKVSGQDDQQLLLKGLQRLNEKSRTDFSMDFAKVGEKEQFVVLQYFEQRTKETEDEFFSMLKSMTIYGYYTSEIGASQELIYVHAAGTYEDRKFSDVGKNYY